MADEMEQIEARLAAYVDGTLPVEQRAEIEAYLKDNPTHGRLITELKSIKFAVTTLPKEKAPAEILDTLQSHLERHTLLEGVEDSVVSSRIRRWPQFGALAAVLLLTVGLGILVYQVLPQKKGPSPELALLPDSTQQVTADDSLAAGAGGGVNLSDAANSNSNSAMDSRAKADNARADNELNGLASTPEAARRRDMAARQAPGQQMYQNQFGGGNQQSSNQQQADAQAPRAAASPVALPKMDPIIPPTEESFFVPTPAPERPTRILTITTDDPVITQNLIAGYFAQSQLATERLEKSQTSPHAIKDEQPGQIAETKAAESVPDQRFAFDRDASAKLAGLANEGILLRNLSQEKLAEIEAAVAAQRPTRQHAVASWRGETTPAATTAPSSQPVATTMPSLNLPPMALAFKAEAASQPATQPLIAPTTMPQAAAALITPAAAPASDLVIMVVAAPAATQPATAPTTEPTTSPSILP